MDVMRHYQQVKQTLQAQGNPAQSVTEISSICSVEIESLWRKASIPSVSHTRVLKFHDEFRILMKPYKGCKSDKKYIDKLHKFQTKCREKLFDISVCKCVPENCKSPKGQKISKAEEFMKDQRTIRMMLLQEPIG